MKSGWTWIATSLLAGAIALSACGPEKKTSEGGEEASGGEPALVISDQAEWDSLVASGAESFETACGTCHPGGEADLGPALKGENKSSKKMTSQIREGSGKMAPIGEDKLPEAEMKGVLVYLASIKAVGDIKGP